MSKIGKVLRVVSN